jgi:hypothetical protein
MEKIRRLDDNTLTCRNCNEDRDKVYFVNVTMNNKIYYKTKKCKVCSGVKIKTPNTITPKIYKGLSKECLEFLNALKITKRYYCDLIDSYKLTHYFIQVFGDVNLDKYTIEEQLVIMLNELLKEKRKGEEYI